MTMATSATLVTGASGYLGRLLVRRLAAADLPVIATDIKLPPESERISGVTYVALDIRDAMAVRGVMSASPIGVVAHLAAIVTPPKGADPNLAYDVDVGGTRNVLEACLAANVAKVIVTSSGAAYGYYPDNAPLLDEDAPLRGNACFAYSHHKRLVEHMLAEYRARHPELKQLVFRPGTILGAGTKNQITAIFERKVILGIRGASSPFVFIWDEDVVTCLERGVREPDLVGIYNLAGSGTMTLADIANALAKPYLALPAETIRTGLAMLDKLHLSPYGPEQVLFLQHRPVLDNRRLVTELGFTPKSTREVFELWRTTHP